MTKQTLSDFLESQDFYELMQVYRHEPADAAKPFEAVKTALVAAIAQPEQRPVEPAQPVFHLREYGDVTQKQMHEYIATGAISKAQPESKA